MITAIEVQRVARTAQPHTAAPGVVLDIDYVIKHTDSSEWDGDLYELGATAAMQLANQFNVDFGLIANGRRPRLTKQQREVQAAATP